MTRERAIEVLKRRETCMECVADWTCKECNEAFDMAIQALEQEPCEDWYDVPSNEMTLEQTRQAVKDLRKKLAEHLKQEPCEDAISRSEAIRIASGYCHWSNIPAELAKLPSVNPTPCDDAISRQAAIDAVRIGALSTATLYGRSEEGKTARKEIERLIKALPSVSAEKTAIDCSDSICRADAIKLVKSYIHEIITESGVDKNSHTNKILTDIVESLAFELPPVSTEKTGRWEFFEMIDKHYYCSECKSMGVDYWDYCPYCGARMEVEE